MPDPVPAAPIDEPAKPTAPDVVSQVAPVFVPVHVPSTGIQTSHVAGGGFVGLIGAVVVAVCNHFGWHVSAVDAVLVGGTAVSAGIGLGHVVGKVGIFGAVKQLLRGSGRA